MKWLCRFGWHAWPKWTVQQSSSIGVRQNGEPPLLRGIAVAQERECEKCGLRQVRIHSAYLS